MAHTLAFRVDRRRPFHRRASGSKLRHQWVKMGWEKVIQSFAHKVRQPDGTFIDVPERFFMRKRMRLINHYIHPTRAKIRTRNRHQ